MYIPAANCVAVIPTIDAIERMPADTILMFFSDSPAPVTRFVMAIWNVAAVLTDTTPSPTTASPAHLPNVATVDSPLDNLPDPLSASDIPALASLAPLPVPLRALPVSLAAVSASVSPLLTSLDVPSKSERSPSTFLVVEPRFPNDPDASSAAVLTSFPAACADVPSPLIDPDDSLPAASASAANAAILAFASSIDAVNSAVLASSLAMTGSRTAIC